MVCSATQFPTAERAVLDKIVERDVGKPLEIEGQIPQAEARRPLSTAPGASRPLPR